MLVRQRQAGKWGRLLRGRQLLPCPACRHATAHCPHPPRNPAAVNANRTRVDGPFSYPPAWEVMSLSHYQLKSFAVSTFTRAQDTVHSAGARTYPAELGLRLGSSVLHLLQGLWGVTVRKAGL